jgi:hypothetical protein
MDFALPGLMATEPGAGRGGEAGLSVGEQGQAPGVSPLPAGFCAQRWPGVSPHSHPRPPCLLSTCSPPPLALSAHWNLPRWGERSIPTTAATSHVWRGALAEREVGEAREGILSFIEF